EGLNVLLPPLCVMCEKMVSQSHGFCGECWRGFTFISSPMCTSCGLPFEYEVQTIHEAQWCGACLEDAPRFGTARSALVYNEPSKSIILPFKHNDRTDYARAMARMMQTAGYAIIESADALLPVPLHFTRLFSRRYNQSALLVHELGKISHKPIILHALRRVRSTQTQGHLSREQRKKNVHNAFAVDPKCFSQVQGKNLLLVDDVYTTGATANACVAALKKAGAARVDVLTFARVVKTGN
ncbi:MAG: ComF family protein, partial [Alphaproteobacteria bacterium]|nr:ComF family protein [Alphaproteobacteria bacterium]